MSGDACATKMVAVEVQENGIIRDVQGFIIARLTEDADFDTLEELESD